SSTREEEMKRVPWSEADKIAFLAHQFHAQSEHYAIVYENAEFLIISKDGVDIGRMYIDRQPDEIHLVDIALLPEYRGQGIGGKLVQQVLEEGRATGKKVTIYVENFNPARHLYDRLGFRHVDDNGIYHLMEWRATQDAPAPAK
ncbi:MAG TPA: GNAT family N-acetyltransferase, partial [Thermoanaerobaculia bacterium]|nr:GNAT family N-acetyltransferase [Thermoanaerobaculia bacterium]